MGKNSCKNCGTSLIGSICHRCGQKVIVQRWSFKDLWNQFLTQVTNIEKGFLYTIILLFTEPGKLVRDYWNGITVPYYNPFRFALILIAINLLISYWLGINEMLETSMSNDNYLSSIDPDQYEKASNTFNQWLNVLVLLLIPVRSLFTRILFYKNKNNYAEHLILNSYIMGQQGFFSSITQFIFFFFPTAFIIYMPFNFLIGLVYDVWVFRKTFKEHVFLLLLKSALIGILGIIVFLVLVSALSALALTIAG